MKIALPKSEFTLVPDGKQILEITSAKALPSGKPQSIEIEWVHKNGGKLKSKYDFANDKALFALSFLLKNAFGNIDEFDTVMLPQLVKMQFEVEVKHDVKDSTRREGETVTFANIQKVLGKVNVVADEEDNDLE